MNRQRTLFRSNTRQHPYNDDSYEQGISLVNKAKTLPMQNVVERIITWRDACVHFNRANSKPQLDNACFHLAAILSEIPLPTMHQALSTVNYSTIIQWLEMAADTQFDIEKFSLAAKFYNTLSYISVGINERARRKRIEISEKIISCLNMLGHLVPSKLNKKAMHSLFIGNEYLELGHVGQAIRYYAQSAELYFDLGQTEKAHELMVKAAELCDQSNDREGELSFRLKIAGWYRANSSVPAAENYSRISKLYYLHQTPDSQAVSYYSVLAGQTFKQQMQYEKATTEFHIAAMYAHSAEERHNNYVEAVETKLLYTADITGLLKDIINRASQLAPIEYEQLLLALANSLKHRDNQQDKIFVLTQLAQLYFSQRNAQAEYQTHMQIGRFAQLTHKIGMAAKAFEHAASTIAEIPHMAAEYRSALSQAIALHEILEPKPQEDIARCYEGLASRFSIDLSDKRHFMHAAAIHYKEARNFGKAIGCSYQVLRMAEQLGMSREKIIQYESELNVVNVMERDSRAQSILRTADSPVFFEAAQQPREIAQTRFSVTMYQLGER